MSVRAGVSGLNIVFDPTRVAGTVAFGAAALACFHAAAVTPRRSYLWWLLGAVQLACLLEVLLGLRYGWHDTVKSLLQERGWYASRGQWQAELLAVALALIAVLAIFAAWRHRVDGAGRVAIAGTALGVSLLGTEAISLHRVDAIMYARLGPFDALVWMWLAAAAIVVTAALARRR